MIGGYRVQERCERPIRHLFFNLLILLTKEMVVRLDWIDGQMCSKA